MRKKATTLLMAAVFTAGMSMAAYAGWEQDGTQWKYKGDDGVYCVNGWQWIDGNSDGAAECYYFDSNGYMLSNTTTPDGYTVNADGAWVSNSVVQTQKISVQSSNVQETYNAADASDMNWSFGGSTNSGNNISSTGTAGTGYNGIKLLTDEEAYQKILEVKREHPEGTKERDCPAMIEWVNKALYGNANIYLPSKDFDWDDLHVGDEIWYANAETTSHRVIVMEIYDDYILSAESGYAGKVKYGRKITRDEIENEFYKVELVSAWQ